MLSVLCCLWQIVKFCFAGHRELFDTGERVRAMRDFIGEMGGREPAQFPMPPPHGGRCVLFWVSWRSPSCDVWVYDSRRPPFCQSWRKTITGSQKRGEKKRVLFSTRFEYVCCFTGNAARCMPRGLKSYRPSALQSGSDFRQPARSYPPRRYFRPVPHTGRA